MHFLQVSLLSALAMQVAAIPTPSNHVVHEKRDAAPRTWVKRDRLHAEAKLPVRIGMTQSNINLAHDLLMEISTHNSPRYGQHYSAEEVTEMFAPKHDTTEAIMEWLVAAGIPVETISQSTNKQWMQFDTTTSKLEELLATEYHVYEHSDTGRTHVACDSYHIPSHLQDHVDYITPGVKLVAPTRKRNAEASVKRRAFGLDPAQRIRPITVEPTSQFGSDVVGSGCDTEMTPACIKLLYGITAGTTAVAGNKLGIFEDLDDVYAQGDLNTFFKKYATTIPSGTGPTVNAIDGAVAPTTVADAGAESDLDLQIAYPIIYPQGAVLFQTDDMVYEADYTYEGFLNTFLDALDGSYCSSISPLDPVYPDPSNAKGSYKSALQCGVYTPTNVISISYGGDEADLTVAYQQRQCTEFMKLGLQGVSVLVSSGDSGVGGSACLGSNEKVFSPDFPATCPYITAVGGTVVPSGGTSEVAVTRFGSGGGFSNIYPIPSYQSSAVSTYLTSHTPSYKSYQTVNATAIGTGGGIYNSIGRGYPDVSAIGDNVVIVNAGSAELIGGTSCSSPTFGAILTRINEQRLGAGKSTVGFVNPTLYANPTVLTDITVGDNPGCGTNGFKTATGWDPVTGLGTPQFAPLLALFLSLP